MPCEFLLGQDFGVRPERIVALPRLGADPIFFVENDMDNTSDIASGAAALRLECLKLAHDKWGGNDERAVSAARSYAVFVLGEEPPGGVTAPERVALPPDASSTLPPEERRWDGLRPPTPDRPFG